MKKQKYCTNINAHRLREKNAEKLQNTHKREQTVASSALIEKLWKIFKYILLRERGDNNIQHKNLIKITNCYCLERKRQINSNMCQFQCVSMNFTVFE